MLERIAMTLDDLLLRANAAMLGATKQALQQPRPEKGHRLQRTSRHEATCTCGLWSCRTDEVDENEIARTLAANHAAHVARDENSTTTEPKPKEKR